MKVHYILALIALLFAGAAYAQQDYPRDITLTWTNADSYTDGTPILAGDLESVRVECFRNQDTVPTVSRTVPDTGEGAAQTETFTGAIPSPGVYTCVAYSIVVGGAESDASGEASRKYTGKPLPPQNFN
jgi:hypothetical protein